MQLRLIEPKDLPVIIAIRASTRENAISHEALRKMGVTEESAAEVLRTTHRGWLCEEGGQVVGFAIGDGKTGEIWVIAILPEFEGKGMGSRLLEAVESWLWSLGWQELWLWTSSDPRKRALTFYLKRGWFISETRNDIVVMKKRMA